MPMLAGTPVRDDDRLELVRLLRGAEFPDTAANLERGIELSAKIYALTVELGARARDLLARASGRLGAVQVDDERPFSDEGDDESLRFVHRVYVSVDESNGHVKETALLNLRALRATRPKFETDATPDDVREHFAISVVMPT